MKMNTMIEKEDRMMIMIEKEDRMMTMIEGNQKDNLVINTRIVDIVQMKKMIDIMIDIHLKNNNNYKENPPKTTEIEMMSTILLKNLKKINIKESNPKEMLQIVTVVKMIIMMITIPLVNKRNTLLLEKVDCLRVLNLKMTFIHLKR